MKLRQIADIETVDPSHEMDEDEGIQFVFGELLENLPNVHVEFENDGPGSDVEIFPMSKNNSSQRPLRSIENEISNALFNSENVQDSRGWLYVAVTKIENP